MPKYLDLFAGAGGLSEGFIRAGYEPVAHVEMDAAACYTLKTRAAYHWLRKKQNLGPYTCYLKGELSRTDFYNQIPEEVLGSVLNYEISKETLPTIFKDIDELLGDEKLDLIVGGPHVKLIPSLDDPGLKIEWSVTSEIICISSMQNS